MKISTESYKGVRDFYPEDMFVQKYIFETMRSVVEKYGYVEYGASVLEPTELYKAKSGEEIVNEQTYSFIDRGDRDVTLRPEMTPTVARMIAAKKRELPFPLRWYSIPNLFRYEKPQRGRLREHWQLNADLFGLGGVEADAEVITMAARLLEAFGAKSADFEIRINHRGLLRFILEKIYKFNDADSHALTKLLDKKSKMESAKFRANIEEIIGDKTDGFLQLLEIHDPVKLKAGVEQWHKVVPDGIDDVISLQKSLQSVGVATRFDLSLVRGFDYYTGTVFEVFDTNPENRRSLFGGGRYDDLLSVFGSDKVPAIGFGAGDVGIKDFLEVRKLLPAFTSTAMVCVCPISAEDTADALSLAEFLRTKKINVAVDTSDRKIGDKIKATVKLAIPFVVIVGKDERTSGVFTLKNLAKETEKKMGREDIASHLKK